MKNILLAASAILFFNLFAAASASAQDHVFYQTGEEQTVKVLEITASEIKFKKWDNLAGPTHSIPKTDVWMIKYENGTKELIYKQTAAAQKAEIAEPAATSKTATVAVQQPKKETHIFIDEESQKPAKKESNRNDFHLFGGVSMPNGKFAEPTEGGAKMGFALGLEEITRFGNGMIRPTFSLQFSKNSIDGAVNLPYEGGIYHAKITGGYRSITGLTGLRFETAGENTKFYAAAAAGYALTNANMTVIFDEFVGEVKQNVGSRHLTYNFGAGVLIGKLDIGLRLNKATAIFTGDFEAKQAMNTLALTVGCHF